MGENNSEGEDWINSFEFALLSEKLKEAKQKDEELKEKLTQEVKKATMELKEINDKKTEFMLEIGHKLKTPLTVINTSVDYLMMKGSCKEDEKFLTILKKNVEGLRRAVEQIFKTAQIDLGIFEERFEKFDLSELLYEVVSSFNISCQQLDIEKGLYIQGDKEKLIALFENLIHNAVKFNREGGKISITLCKQNGFATFSVKDEGHGISTEERERIFDKFYHRDREGKEKGTGLGLYIAKRVVELHGGKIGFDTKVGEGTTFIVKLPLISERGKDSYGKEATNH
jgi:signal transduction histidine kinase